MEDIVLICCVALGKSLTSLNLSPSLVRWRRQVWRDKGVHHEGDIVLETGTSHLFLYIKGNQEDKSQAHGTVTHEHRHSRYLTGPGKPCPGSETYKGRWQERVQVATLAQTAGRPSETWHRGAVASLP